MAIARIFIVEDAFKDVADVAPEKRDDWAEVQNYIQALNYAVTRLETLPLSNQPLVVGGARHSVARSQGCNQTTR